MMSLGSEHPQQKTGVTIFATGGGTNAENCIRYFKGHQRIYINLIVSNKPHAGVLSKAEKYQIPARVITSEAWKHPDALIAELRAAGTGFIVLAGYLALVPQALIAAYPGRIINIHPALLPKFGGKGMFGKRIHEAVINEGEKETGITIHEVNEEYDKGKILFQKKIEIDPDDTPESLENKVRKLEYYYLPRVIESLISQKLQG